MISFCVEMAVNMHQSLSVFSEVCDSMNYIFPNLPSMIQPVPASSLRLISLDNLTEAGPPPSKGGHFFTINLDTFKKFPNSHKAIQTHVRENNR